MSRRPPLRRVLAAAAALTGLLATTACGGPSDAPGGPSAAGSGAVSTAVPASLSFAGKTVDGAPFDAATIAGKPALLWFWAPWCATCAGQADSINELKAQYGDRLAIVGVAGLGDNAAMREFVADLDVHTVPNLDDQGGELWRRFGVTEQSTFVLIDRQGTVVETRWLDRIDLAAEVTALVA